MRRRPAVADHHALRSGPDRSTLRTATAHAGAGKADRSGRPPAGFALAEAVTLVADGHVPADVVAAARTQFDPAELAELLMAIVVINSWNRVAITSRMPLPPSWAG